MVWFQINPSIQFSKQTHTHSFIIGPKPLIGHHSSLYNLPHGICCWKYSIHFKKVCTDSTLSNSLTKTDLKKKIWFLFTVFSHIKITQHTVLKTRKLLQFLRMFHRPQARSRIHAMFTKWMPFTIWYTIIINDLPLPKRIVPQFDSREERKKKHRRRKRHTIHSHNNQCAQNSYHEISNKYYLISRTQSRKLAKISNSDWNRQKKLMIFFSSILGCVT